MQVRSDLNGIFDVISQPGHLVVIGIIPGHMLYCTEILVPCVGSSVAVAPSYPPTPRIAVYHPANTKPRENNQKKNIKKRPLLNSARPPTTFPRDASGRSMNPTPNKRPMYMKFFFFLVLFSPSFFISKFPKSTLSIASLCCVDGAREEVFVAEFDRKGRDELTPREIRASHFAKEPPSRLGHWKYRRVVSAPRQGR